MRSSAVGRGQEAFERVDSLRRFALSTRFVLCSPRPLPILDPALADRLFCDAGVGIRHMEAVPLDIVQAIFDVDAGLFLTTRHLECFEGGPRSVLDREVATLAVACEAEYATCTSEDMNRHGHL
jgi:hypothetical protein